MEQHGVAMNRSNLSYAQTPRTQGFTYSTIPEKLNDHASHTPEKPAFIIYSCDGDRQEISCKDLFEKCRIFAKGLVRLGINRNDVVAVSFPNTLDWLVSTFGIQMAGAVPFHISYKYTDGRDIIPLLKHVDCSTIIIDATNHTFINNVVTDYTARYDLTLVTSSTLPCLKFCFVNAENTSNGCMSMSKIFKSGQRENEQSLPELDPDNIAALLLTSGSTGVPKVVPKTHVQVLEMGRVLLTDWELGSDDRLFNDRLFNWLGGYPSLFISSGITYVTTSDQYTLKSIDDICKFCVKVIKLEKCTMSLFFPAFIQEIIKGNIQDIPQQRLVFSGGVPIPKQCSDIIGKIATEFVNGYGSTEVGLVSLKTVQKSEDYANYCVGKPTAGVEMKIIDKDGKIVEKNQVGEIFVRKHLGFIGYYKDPYQTKQVLLDDGWFKTDDVGYMDDNGDFYVTGRHSDVIVCFGELVSPSYIENEIQAHPAVLEVCVVPIADPVYFQKVCICVVLQKNSDLCEGELRSYFSNNKQGFKFKEESRLFLFFDSFPKTTVGKIYRNGVREEAEKRLK